MEALHQDSAAVEAFPGLSVVNGCERMDLDSPIYENGRRKLLLIYNVASHHIIGHCLQRRWYEVALAAQVDSVSHFRSFVEQIRSTTL
jgi:hypothetical protein